MDSKLNYKRIVIKIGSSSLTHAETGRLNLAKMEHLVRQLSDLHNQGMDVCLVSSGAIAVGRAAMGVKERPSETSVKQACAAVGQAKLMMVYQKLFAEYSQTAGQILLTKNTMVNPVSRANAKNTFDELFHLGVIPVVNENDTVSTYEMQFGDNDTLSALVASMVGADLLILLSDIDGLYTDDPHKNPEARLLKVVDAIDENIYGMAKESTGSNVGTGGMATKLAAAKIATLSGTDIEAITYFYDTLHFSADLVEYLIEYCVENGHKSMHYIQKVALAWSEEHITTVEQARNSSKFYNKNCYSILNAFGIKGRAAAAPELAYIKKWTEEYGFSLDLIIEACNRTMAKLHQPSFEYTDSILKKWIASNVHHLSDLKRLDSAHRQTVVRRRAETKPVVKNKFNNFEGRTYDYDSLEKQLLSQ